MIIKDTKKCPYCFHLPDIEPSKNFQLVICKNCGKDFEVRKIKIISYEFQ